MPNDYDVKPTLPSICHELIQPRPPSFHSADLVGVFLNSLQATLKGGSLHTQMQDDSMCRWLETVLIFCNFRWTQLPSGAEAEVVRYELQIFGIGNGGLQQSTGEWFPSKTRKS
jgi:hypothetical protein